MSRIKLTRISRVNMFLTDYYIGPTMLHQFMRLCSGPLLIFFGYWLFKSSNIALAVYYGVFCAILGTYYILKPIIWVLTKWENYKEVEIDVEMNESGIKLREKNRDLQINFSEIKKIHIRKTHYSLTLENEKKLYLPVDSLSEEEQAILKRSTIAS